MDNLIEYQVENPKDSTYRLLDIICKFNIFADCKVNTSISNKTLYNIHDSIQSIKIFRTNLSKIYIKHTHRKLQNTAEKNYERLNEYGDIPCSWIKRFVIKISTNPKLIYKSL